LLLRQVVPLHDIADIENFVAGVITKAVPNLEHQEFQELKAEGIALLYRLADRYDPHRPGYERPGSFAGYASMFLPRKLGDAWHRMHPEHQYVTEVLDDGTLKRRWRYHRPPESLDHLLAANDDTRGHQGGSERGERLDKVRTGRNMVPLASPYAHPVAA
jgi:hypothetical protein